MLKNAINDLLVFDCTQLKIKIYMKFNLLALSDNVICAVIQICLSAVKHDLVAWKSIDLTSKIQYNNKSDNIILFINTLLLPLNIVC